MDFPIRIEKCKVDFCLFSFKDNLSLDILPNLLHEYLSNEYEMCSYDQIYEYFYHTLSKSQLGLCKSISTQYGLFFMIKKIKCLEKGGEEVKVGLCYILHKLVMAKLDFYGFNYQTLEIL